jgi:hypothetical protein
LTLGSCLAAEENYWDGRQKKFGGDGRGMWMSHEVFFLGIFMFYFWPIIKMFMLRIFFEEIRKIYEKNGSGLENYKTKTRYFQKKSLLGVKGGN